MTVKEIMERSGLGKTGLALAYIKDGLEEINMLSETHIKTVRIDIEKDKRFYEFPSDMIKLKDVRCKNHLNTKDEYRSIPRAIGTPNNKDEDGI
tara:strand:+ start:1003 stop:1284 length:282 start_codon:yes stop_codon:yes gene_type:complete